MLTTAFTKTLMLIRRSEIKLKETETMEERNKIIRNWRLKFILLINICLRKSIELRLDSLLTELPFTFKLYF